jgi:hypothetical protein
MQTGISAIAYKRFTVPESSLLLLPLSRKRRQDNKEQLWQIGQFQLTILTVITNDGWKITVESWRW